MSTSKPAEKAATTTNNLALWESVQKTDPNYTKGFNRGGGFKGTATNATFLAKKATEHFGPCGIGWGMQVLSEEVLMGHPLRGNDGAVIGHTLVHKVHAKLWYVLNGQRGEIEQFGQTELAGQRNDGKFYTDEEAPKKSLTDAMTKALSLLGFAADIHLGLYDDNKYVAELRGEYGTGKDHGPSEREPEQRPASNGNGDRKPPQRDGGPKQEVAAHVKAMREAQTEPALKRAFALGWKQYENPSDPKAHTAAQVKLKEVYDSCMAKLYAAAASADGREPDPDTGPLGPDDFDSSDIPDGA